MEPTMAKTPGGSSDSKKTKGKKKQYDGRLTAEIAKGDPRGPRKPNEWRNAQSRPTGFYLAGFPQNAGSGVGVGPSQKGGTGARRGRPPGVKNGQGRGKK